MTKSQIIKEKLTYYNKPFITKDFLQKLFDKFAPWYTPAEASKRWLIQPLKSDKIYFNLLYKWFIHPYVVGALYCHKIPYMFGWLQVYNQYGYTTQVPERYTVYNTTYNGKKIFHAGKIIFKKVRENFFYGQATRTIDNAKVVVMSPERALLQLIKESNGKIEFDEDIYQLMEQKKIDNKKLLILSQKHTSKKVQTLVHNFLQHGWFAH